MKLHTSNWINKVAPRRPSRKRVRCDIWVRLSTERFAYAWTKTKAQPPRIADPSNCSKTDRQLEHSKLDSGDWIVVSGLPKSNLKRGNYGSNFYFVRDSDQPLARVVW